MSSLKAQILAELGWRSALPPGSEKHLESGLLADQGNPLEFLLQRGIEPEELLQAAASASGLTPAPKRLLKAPQVSGIDAAACIPFGGVPIGTRDGMPLIAFSDPDRVLDAAVSLPEHQALLALPDDVAHARRTLGADPHRAAPKATAERGALRRSEGAGSNAGASGAFEARPTVALKPSATVADPDLPPFGPSTEQAAAGFDDDRTVVGTFSIPPEPDDEPPPPEPAERTVMVDFKKLSEEAMQAEAEAAAAAEPSPGLLGHDDDALPFDGPTDRAGAARLQVDPVPTVPTLQGRGLREDAPTIASEPLRLTDNDDASASLSTSWLPGNPLLAAAARADDKVSPRSKARAERRAPSLAEDTDDGASAERSDDEYLFDEEDVPGTDAGEDDAAEAFDDAAARATDEVQRATLDEGGGIGSLDDDDDDVDLDGDEGVLDTRSLHVDTSVASTGFTGGIELEHATIQSEPLGLAADGTRPTPTGLSVSGDGASARGASARGASARGASAEAGFASTEVVAPLSGEAGSSEHSRPPDPAFAGIPRYDVRGVIGRGGMAAVHIAQDKKTGRDVALKILEAHLADDDIFIERFRREVASTKALQHENIIRLFDAGESGDTYYMAMELVDGGTLSELLRKTGPMPAQLVVPIMDMALAGLHYAHESGTVHRDLKPANLMLTKGGVLKIGDFGIAKTSTDETLTKTGTLFGTPAYMSPEQAMGRALDARSDLFSIGIVFYQLLTGTNPFHSENPSTSLYKIANGRFPPVFSVVPWVPDALDQVVSRLLKTDREQRYPSGEAARTALAPLKALIDARWPSVLPEALARPREVTAQLKEETAALQVSHGKAHLSFKPPRSEEASFRFYLGTRLDEANYEAVNGLAELRLQHGYRFEPEVDARIAEVHQALRDNKPTPALLRRAHDLHAAQKDLFGMARYGKQYLELQPHDEHMRLKYINIAGSDALAPYSAPPSHAPQFRPSTEAPKAAAEDIVPGLAPAGGVRGAPRPAAATRPAAAVRPAARVGLVGAAAGGAGIAVADGASDLVPPTGVNRALASSTDEGRPEKEPEGPKDSFDALLDFMRSGRDEIIRSLTGDQGVAGLKEWWHDRFNAENKAELKEQAQQLLGHGKQALEASKQKLLDEQNREKVKGEAVTMWQKHRRVIMLAGAVFLFLWLLKAGCGFLLGAAVDSAKASAPTMGSAGKDGAAAPED